MKKIVSLAAIAVALTFSACNSCGGNQQPPIVIESETDSLYMLNDSTIADKQTFIFEGLMPLDNGAVGNTVLTVQTLSLNDDGTYTLNTSYIDESNNTVNNSDSGETTVVIGIPNDSTAIIYELVSYNNNPKINLMVNSDSSLTRLNGNMKPASTNPKHRLMHRPVTGNSVAK